MNTEHEEKITLGDNEICLILIESPFDFDRRDKKIIELDNVEPVYLSDLLPKVYRSYVVSVNGEIVEQDDWVAYPIEAGQYIVFCPIPEGGGGNSAKNIFRMVALIGLSYFTFGTTGSFTLSGLLGGAVPLAAQMAVFAGGSFLINSLLPNTTDDILQGLNKSPSYGVDGPKNTSREGVPVPVVYGKFRVAGNLINVYTENHAQESQYIYMMFALSEGKISAIEEDSILINDRPITDFKDREVAFALGDKDQTLFSSQKDPVSWFADIYSSNNVAQKLPSNMSNVIVNVAPCDRVRVDLLFPQGLCRKSDKGNVYGHSIQIEASIDGGPFYNVADIVSDPNARSKVYVYNYVLHSRPNGSQQVTYLVQESGVNVVRTTLEADTYEVDGVIYKDILFKPQASSQKEEAQPLTVRVGYVVNDPDDLPKNPVWEVYGESSDAYRVSYFSDILTHGPHTVTLRRTTAENTGPEFFDECYLQDVVEMNSDHVKYKNTALLAIKIRASDQLTSIPSVSAVVHGKVCDIPLSDASIAYLDVLEWSDNPAYIAMDMMTNSRYGANIPIERLNVAAFLFWYSYCHYKGLKFNGVFDTNMTIWDALQAVFRVGRAQLINMGTIFSVAMEAPGEPTMMFNVGNIIQDSFKISWLPLQDRANEIEISYFDEENNYKQTTLRLTDSEDPTSNSHRTASITLYGCTNKDQAIAEAELMLRMNRYITQTVTFDAPVEAIACTVGDLVLVQHDIPQWAFGGRLEHGSTTTNLKVDRPISLVDGSPHKILLHLDYLERSTQNVINVIDGVFLKLDGYPFGRYRKVVHGTEEYTIQNIVQENLLVLGVILDRNFGGTVGATVSLIDTDLIEEATIQTIAGDGMSVTLASPLPFSPPVYTKWLFGPTDRCKKPFRVISISGGSDFNRTITALEYHESVYGNTGDFVPPINLSLLGLIAHVANLTYAVRSVDEGGQVLPVIDLFWEIPSSGAYSGADIYVRQENGVWQLAGEARHGITQFTYKGGIYGEKIQFKVQAYDALGKRADFSSAPVTDLIDLSLAGVYIPPVLRVWVTEIVDKPPTAQQIYSTLTVGIDPPTITEDPDGLFNHAVIDYRILNKTADYTLLGNTVDSLTMIVLRTGETYEFRARSADVEGNISREEVTAQYTVTAAGMSLAPTVDRLRLVNGSNGDDHLFDGTTIQIEWDTPSTADWHEVGNPNNTTHLTEFKHYEIKIFDGNNIFFKSYIRYDNNFAYTLAMNQSDYAEKFNVSGANRQVLFKVYVHGNNLQISGQPAELMTLNPPPVVEGLAISGGYNEIIISYAKIIDADFVALKFYVDDTDPEFVTNDGVNLELTTSSTPASPSYITTYRGGQLESGKPYYVRYKAVDGFGETAASFSMAAMMNWKIGDLASTLPDWVLDVDPADREWIMDNLIMEDSIESTQIANLTAAKITAGVLHATVAVESDGWISVSDAYYGANPITNADFNAPATPAVHEVRMGQRDFTVTVNGQPVVKTSYFSFTQNNIPLVAFYTDGTAEFRGKVTVTDGSNVEIGATVGADWTTNIKNLPLTIRAFKIAFEVQGDGKIVTFFANLAPAAEDTGDYWVDTDAPTETIYRWNGSGWVVVTDDKLVEAIIRATNQAAKDSGRVDTYLSEEDPDDTINPAEGDLWYQPSTQLLSRYKFSTLAWESASNIFFQTSDFLDDAKFIQPLWDFIRGKPEWVTDFNAANLEQIDREIVVVYDDNEPLASAYLQGDLWYDTDDNLWYRHDNGAWVLTAKNGIILALEQAYSAQAAADGTVRTYFGSVAPTLISHPDLSFGDLWYNPDSERLFQWDGANWRPFSVTKTSNLDDDALLGETAQWYMLDNMPSRFNDSATNGVNVTATHIGIYQNGWRVYMDYLGRLFLNDGDPDHFIAWNGSTLAIKGEVRATDIKAQSTIVGSTWKTSEYGERVEMDHSRDGLIFYDDTNRQSVYLGRDEGEDANLVIDKSHSGGNKHGIKIKAGGYGISVNSNYYGVGVTCNGMTYPAIVATGNKNIGVYGNSHADGILKGVGVAGHATGIDSIGVKGTSRDTSGGIGVFGESFCGILGRTVASANGPQAPIELPDPVGTSNNPENILKINAPEEVVEDFNPISYHRLTETGGAPKVKDWIGSKNMVWVQTSAPNGPSPRSTDIIGDGDRVVTGQLNGLGGAKLSEGRLVDNPSGDWTFNCLVIMSSIAQNQTILSQWLNTEDSEMEIKLISGVVTVNVLGSTVHSGGTVATGQLQMITVVKDGPLYKTYINGVLVA